MPANLSPEYKAAEAAFKQAREPRERLEALREMLRTIPKHKGTEHLQADIKTRIKHLTEELAAGRKGGSRTGPVHVIRPEGAAQIALLGPPNTGKSSLHARFTGSGAEAGPYPFTTQGPQPGMLPHEDIHFQLVDLPPIARAHTVPWIANALQPADAALLVVDLTNPECVEEVMALREILAEKRIVLLESFDPEPAAEPGDAESEDAIDDPFAIRLPSVLIASKADRLAAPEEEVAVLQELLGTAFPALAVSSETGDGLAALGPLLFERLRIVRVYTKAPGRAPETEKPFAVRAGQTVLDVATLVHRDIAAQLKYARVWGPNRYAGQQVSRDHAVDDGDILELHT